MLKMREKSILAPACSGVYRRRRFSTFEIENKIENKTCQKTTRQSKRKKNTPTTSCKTACLWRYFDSFNYFKVIVSVVV